MSRDVRTGYAVVNVERYNEGSWLVNTLLMAEWVFCILAIVACSFYLEFVDNTMISVRTLILIIIMTLILTYWPQELWRRKRETLVEVGQMTWENYYMDIIIAHVNAQQEKER